MKLYAYCFTEGIEALPEALTGIAGNPVRLLRAEEFSILVSDFSGDTVPVNRQTALAHAAVIQCVLTHTTPLPVRFGTLVAEQELRNYVTAKRAALRKRVQSVRGCVEMNVKVIWHQAPAADLPPPDIKDKPGTAFLAQKRQELLGSEIQAAEAKKVAAWLEERLGGTVREKKNQENPTGKLLLAAAHLVERDGVEVYRMRLKAALDQRPELHFLVSGPWAPYSFANIELEFKSRFGVS